MHFFPREKNLTNSWYQDTDSNGKIGHFRISRIATANNCFHLSVNMYVVQKVLGKHLKFDSLCKSIKHSDIRE